MTRQLEADLEDRQAKKRILLAHAIDYGLPEAISASGMVYDGFAYKNNGTDALLVLKAHGEDGRVVAFVGSACVSDCIVKAAAEARSGTLNWRDDKWAGE